MFLEQPWLCLGVLKIFRVIMKKKYCFFVTFLNRNKVLSYHYSNSLSRSQSVIFSVLMLVSIMILRLGLGLRLGLITSLDQWIGICKVFILVSLLKQRFSKSWYQSWYWDWKLESLNPRSWLPKASRSHHCHMYSTSLRGRLEIPF